MRVLRHGVVAGDNRAEEGHYEVTCSTSEILRRITFRECKFEVNNLTSVTAGIYLPTVNNTGCSASGCDFGTFTTAAISVAISTIASAYNLFSQYDNYASTGTTLSTGTPPGMYIGTRFVGESAAIPTSGYYKRSDSLSHTTPSSGSPQGWICIATGMPGTWASMGNLA